ncbi:MAG: zinc-ribbon domain-containing protein [Clostridia bacterium]|nr:zinc-ribbon domain-containing protein [Clostridia bacterium]
MFCSNCGAQLNEGSNFCHVCGQAAGALIKKEKAPVVNEPKGNPTPVLVWGILGLAFALSGPISFLGIIFSCIGRGKAAEYVDRYGDESKQATVGRNLSKAGLIVGIVMTVLFVLYCLFMVGLFGYFIRNIPNYR